MANVQLLSQTDNPLIQSQSGLQADGQKVQPIGQTKPNPIDALVDCPIQPKVGKKKARPHGENKVHYCVITYE